MYLVSPHTGLLDYTASADCRVFHSEGPQESRQRRSVGLGLWVSVASVCMMVCVVVQVAKMVMMREHQLLPRRGEQELMTNFV